MNDQITDPGSAGEEKQDRPADPKTADVLDLAHGHQPALIAETLGVDVKKGLSDAAAARRLKRDGPNVLDDSGGPEWWRVLLRQFSSIVVWLLVAAAVVAWFTSGEMEAIAILGVLVINAIIGFTVEFRANEALKALRRQAVSNARVRRNGAETIVDASGLVLGDVIILTAGDRVPADARLVEATNLQTDESVLTGESVSVDKHKDPVGLSSIVAERHSMIYLGTSVVRGHAVGIATATGRYTEMGRIGRLLARTESEKTPLERRLDQLGKILVFVVLGIAALIMVAGSLRGDPVWLMLQVSISLAVAAVPEALPAMTTLILALGVLRMARQNAIVRRLAAVEALGSTTVICTDKTGTLTENRMTVKEYRLSSGRRVSAAEEAAKEDPVLSRLLRVAILCNEAAFHPGSSRSEKIGDPTETALLASANSFGRDIQADRDRFETLFEEPFEAATRRMTLVVKDRSGDGEFALIKGAPGVILGACSHFASEIGDRLPLDESAREGFLSTNEQMANEALRVLSFADKEAGDDGAALDHSKGFTFLGFVGMADPLRLGVTDAIQSAREAGIRTVMLTGDQLLTAQAIARELNLSNNGDVVALHSKDIAGGDDRSLAANARKAHVFARVSPEDKLRIVEALQGAGEFVAVTGDGINDAPALKRSNIGIAMGQRGTEVAKEASDIVLTDDNFATIVRAVEGGRTIYANIIKFVHLLFSDNLSEVLVIFGAIMIALPLPLLPLQILWINLVTDVFPAMALAVEPASPGTMKRKPHAPGEAILSRGFLFLILWKGLLYAAIVLGAYFWALEMYGEGPHARTVALLSLIAVQLGNLFNCRSRSRSAFERFFSNPFIFAAIAISVLLQLLAVYFDPLSRILGTTVPNAIDLAVIGAAFVLPVLFIEITKAVARGLKGRTASPEIADERK
ncbi:MAG: cation-translocating P-type ATPase [Pyrinomonadaceae bacterium]